MLNKISTKKKLLAGVFLIFLFIIIYYAINNKKLKVVLGNQNFIMDVADTSAKQAKGLSGRRYIKPYGGMAFIFPNQDKYGFWMKEMNFPLDIIWVSSEYKIVDIKKNFSPSSYPEIYYPKDPAMYTFEITAGKSDELNLKIGDSIKFLKK